MSKIFYKAISFCLIIATLFSLSVNVFATTVRIESDSALLETETPMPETNASLSKNDNGLNPIIIKEEISLRSKQTKVFLCDDGSYMAVNYYSDVHELDEKGNWVDCSSDITASPDKAITVDGDIKTVPQSKSGSGSIYLVNNNYSLGWNITSSLNGANHSLNRENMSVEPKKELQTIGSDDIMKIKTQAEVIAKQSTNVKETEITSASSLPSSDTKALIKETNEKIKIHNDSVINNVSYSTEVVEYKEAFSEGTAVRYTLTNSSVKEDIILYKPVNFSSYSMHIEKNGLEPVLNENNEINFFDEKGNVIFIIQSPVMYDSSLNSSCDIDVDLSITDTEFVITYTPSQEWLNSEKITYPVTIDPLISNAVINGIDIDMTFVSDQFVNNSMQYEKFVCVGNEANSVRDYGESEAWFAMGEMPFYSAYPSTITSSYIDFVIHPSYCQTDIAIDAYIPNTTYTDLVTWSSKPNTPFLFESNITPSTSNGNYVYRVPLRTLTSQWYANTNAMRFGLVLKLSTGQNGCNIIYTHRVTVDALKPKLVINYYNATTPEETKVTDLETGLYSFTSSQFPNRYLSLAPNEYDVVASTAYKTWVLANNGDGTYSFIPNGIPTHRLETHCGQYSDYRPITNYDYVSTNNTGSNAVKYEIYQNSSGTYSIRPTSNTSYAISVYTGSNCNMYFYNWYTPASYRKFIKTNETSVQLNKYVGDEWQRWNITSVGELTYASISDFPTVTYNGVTEIMMTKADYHRLSIVEPYAPLNNVCWTSSNPAVATIEPTGKTPKITGVADGTTIISLVTPGGTVCDSFVLRVYDPTLYATGSVEKAKCDLRGYRLDVPLIPQTRNYTCGSACSIMIINYLNGSLPDELDTDTPDLTFYNLIGYDDKTNLSHISLKLNTYIIPNYASVYTSPTAIATRVINNITNNYPVIINVKPLSDTAFNYTIGGGHYVLVKGIYKGNDGEYYFIINDPFHLLWSESNPIGQEITISQSKLLECYELGSIHTSGVIS